MRTMPLCLDCPHEYAEHVRLGPSTGAFSCRADGCACRVYVARAAAIAAARQVAA